MSDMWLGVDLKADTKETCKNGLRAVNMLTILDSIVMILGGAYMTS